MSPTAVARPPTSRWHGENVDAATIERELAELQRRHAAPVEGDGEQMATVRASVLNLIVLARDREQAERAAEQLGRLAHLHPARTILVLSHGGSGEPRLDASVESLSQVLETGGEPRRVLREEVWLEAWGPAARNAASVIPVLLLSDLPTVLWWTGDPNFDDEYFRHLAPLCGTVVVDSTRFSDADEGLARLRALATALHGIRLRDLTWCRLGPWRELCAQFFDPPENRPLIPLLRSIDVTYAGASPATASSPARAPNTAQPLLLAGWLTAQLGWRPATQRRAAGGARTVTLHSAHGEQDRLLTLSVVPVDMRVLRSGDVVSLRLEAHPQRRAGSGSWMEVARVDRAHVRTQTGSGEKVSAERIVSLAFPPDAELLADELAGFARDPVFTKALGAAALLAGGRRRSAKKS